MTVFVLSHETVFPAPSLADPDGLLAIGGDLSPERLIAAYRQGIFPWYGPGEPILWWSPDPRLVLFPEELHVPRRLKRTIRKGVFQVTWNSAFEEVIRGCSEAREETWLSTDMMEAYIELHRRGYAISVEAYLDGRLSGGFYGVLLGRVFFGESMFTRVRDASKVAFVQGIDMLCQRGVRLIDCQVETGHLKRFGARPIPREIFLRLLKKLIPQAPLRGV